MKKVTCTLLTFVFIFLYLQEANALKVFNPQLKIFNLHVNNKTNYSVMVYKTLNGAENQCVDDFGDHNTFTVSKNNNGSQTIDANAGVFNGCAFEDSYIQLGAQVENGGKQEPFLGFLYFKDPLTENAGWNLDTDGCQASQGFKCTITAGSYPNWTITVQPTTPK